MRRLLFLSLPALLLALTGCPSKPKTGECTSNKDCEAQEGVGKICVEGRCQECGQDTDCKAGFVCRDLKCVPRPECEKDADCGEGKTCQDGRCTVAAAKAECDKDADCGAGRACEAGKCVAAKAVPGCPTDGNYEPVHFGFDQSTITPEARGILDADAACVKQQKPKLVTVAGHCDERGTTEYNLQLGQRRADAVKKYFVNLGIPAGELKTVTYGKERPLCTESNEECWARNRRAQISGQ